VATADSLAQSLASEYDVNYAWEGAVLRMRRTGIKGELQVSPDDIAIHVELGFFFRPFKARIEQEIHQHLNQMLDAD